MSSVTLGQVVLGALNVVQVVALAYIAAKYRASSGNGQGPSKS